MRTPQIRTSPALLGLNPVGLFATLRTQMGGDAAFFRASEREGDRFKPAYAILAFQPYESIRCRGGVARIESANGQKEEIPGDPFSIISDRLEARRVMGGPRMGAFEGGALGYFAYDSVRFLEPKLQKAGHFVGHEQLARSYDAEALFFRFFIVFDHERAEVALIDMCGSSDAELRELESHCLTAQARVNADVTSSSELVPELEPELELSAMEALSGKAEYLAGVRKLKGHIRAGDIFQAVLSDRFRHAFQGDPIELFRILSRVSPAPYEFCFLSENRAYLGASPEMLLRLRGQELETHPIAGTRPRGKDAREEKRNEAQLLRSVKEKAEHLMLVDLSRNDIGRVAKPGSVEVREYMKVRKFGGVMHLVSSVHGKLLESVAPLRALASCFPAGTLSGAPKVRAMELLAGLEKAPRGFYGGAVFAASLHGNLDSCIAIRSISIESGQATIQVGAGIVADSNPEREHAEIAAKSRLVRRALGMAARP